jgi:hypothetical protein
MARNKIALIGSGQIGGTLAHLDGHFHRLHRPSTRTGCHLNTSQGRRFHRKWQLHGEDTPRGFKRSRVFAGRPLRRVVAGLP